MRQAKQRDGEEPSADAAVIKDLFNPQTLTQQTRVALFVISLLNFSVEVAEVTEGDMSILEAQDVDQSYTDVDGRYSWNSEMMTTLATELHIPSQFVEIYCDLIPTEFSLKKSDLHDGYLSLLQSTPASVASSVSSADSSHSICNILTISKLAIFLIANGTYNARGRAYIQNLCAVMHISNEEYVRMERTISKGLSHIQASLSRLQMEGDEGVKKGHDYKRYAKIGVVSVGAGALLAFTGGLAAPAVAAALLVFGTSTAVAAAALTSATVMSGLFGSAGMGLAGYKMAKRTRGISEFVFESQEHFGSNLLLTYEEKEEKDSKSGKWSSRFDKKNKRDKEKQKKAEMKKEEEDAEGRINHLSVMICVSGWLIDKEDYKKSFGIVPHEMQDEERLRRFYQLYCPQKVERASEDIKAWKNTGGTSGAVDKERAGYRKGADERSSLDSFKHSVSTNLGSITSAVGGGNDMDEFYQNLTDIYGADPRVVESLVPPPLYPADQVSPLCPSISPCEETRPPPLPLPPGSTSSAVTTEATSSVDYDRDMLPHVLESITIAFEKKKSTDERLNAQAKEQRERGTPPPAVKWRTRTPTPTASPEKTVRKKAQSASTTTTERRGVTSRQPDSDDDSDLDPETETETETETALTGLKLEEDGAVGGGGRGKDTSEVEGRLEDRSLQSSEASDNKEEVAEGKETGPSDDTQARLESDFWHWNQTDLSGVYELNLLRWETPMQLELGKSIQQMLQDLTEAVTTKVLQATVLAALVTAVIVPYSIMKFMDKIDNIWDIATERADSAGKMLAHVLLKRPQGSRSVTLVGHSMGSRLIFACLQELYRCKQLYLEARHAECRHQADTQAQQTAEATGTTYTSTKRKPKKQSLSSSMMSGMKAIFEDDKPIKGDDSNCSTEQGSDAKAKADAYSDSLPLGIDLIDRRLAARSAEDFGGGQGLEDLTLFDLKDADNLVQDVVMLGTPSSTNRAAWTKARAVVTGRFINGYSKNDIILALVYRYNKLAIKVAGLREIHVNGVENINFSDTVKNHTDYCLNMPQILQAIDLLGAPDPANIFMHSARSSGGDDDEEEEEEGQAGDSSDRDKNGVLEVVAEEETEGTELLSPKPSSSSC